MWQEQVLVAVVLCAMSAGLVARRLSPTVGISAALVTLFVLGAIDSGRAFSGFASEAPITIAALYVVAAAVQQTGGLSSVVLRLAGERQFGRVLVVSAVASAFVANTPVVAVLINPVIRWAREHGRSPSKLLLPLSYATILGGMTTIMGTSTNLVGSSVVAGLGQDPLSFFEPARFGLPIAVVGLTITVLTSSRLLPDRGDATEGSEDQRRFTVACSVILGGQIDGLTVEEAGLRSVPGLFLVAVQHSSSAESIAPVAPTTRLQGGDILSFAGSVDRVQDVQNRDGLDFAVAKHLDALEDGQHSWFEAIVGNGSALVGRTLKQADFRSRYQGAVVAIHRSGRPISGRLGEQRLRLGDSLLLVADNGFAQRWNRRSDFVLIRRRSEPPPTASSRAGVSIGILLIVIALSVSQIVDVLRASIIGACLCVILGVLTPRQARNSVDLNVVLLVGAAIGLGNAVQDVGLADLLSESVLGVFGPLGTYGVAFGLTVMALFLTEIITNAGAVAIAAPIAIAAANSSGADPRLFVLGTIAAASASFLTPVGYQTNTMVYGPGRYHFTDYFRVGTPLTAAVLIIVPAMMVM